MRWLTAAGASMVLIGASGAGPAQAATLDPALCAVSPANTFSASVTNPYFPLPSRQGWAYAGVDEGVPLGFRAKVGGTKSFAFGTRTVTTRILQETEWEDTVVADGIRQSTEPLREDTSNYFAQTQAGTACYFGEDVIIYNPDGTTSDTGTWHANDSGAAPGIQMPANPKPGMEYAQENKPGFAEDRGKIVGGGKVTVPAGTFTDTVRVAETNPLEAGKGGNKIYARGVGLVLDDPLALLRYGRNV